MSETFRQKITGAVARGWCHVVNAQKPMDPDLANAITEEVLQELAARWVVEANPWRDALVRARTMIGLLPTNPANDPVGELMELTNKIAAANPWRDAVLRQCEGVDLKSKDPGDVVNALVDRIRTTTASNTQHAVAELRSAINNALEGHGVVVNSLPPLTADDLIDKLCQAVRKDVQTTQDRWRDATQAALRAAGASTTIPLYHDPAQAIEAIVDQARRNALLGVMEYVPQLLNRAMDDLRHDIANPGSLGGVSKSGMQLSSATARIARGLADMQRTGNRL